MTGGEPLSASREAKRAARHLVRLLAATCPEALAAGGRMVVDLELSAPDGDAVRVERIRALARGRRILYDGAGSILGIPGAPDDHESDNLSGTVPDKHPKPER